MDNLILLALWQKSLSFLDGDNASIEDRLYFTEISDQLQVDLLTSFPCMGIQASRFRWKLCFLRTSSMGWPEC
jgi:hypothetical protein